MGEQTEFDYSRIYGGQPGGTAAPHASNDSPAQGAERKAAGQEDADRQSAEQRRQAEQRLQRELEEQLQGLGESVTEGFLHGFEGRGEELGRRARGFGSAVWNLVDYGLARGAEQLRDTANELREQRNEAYRGRAASGRQTSPRRGWWCAPDPPLIAKANTRFGIGLSQTIVGGLLAFGLLLAGLICIIAAPYAGSVYAIEVTGTVGACLFAGGLPFAWLTAHGAGNLGASKRIRAYAGAIGDATHISVQALAEAVQRPVKKVRKDLRRLLSKGWMLGYLDAEADVLYLSAEEWRAARELSAAGQAAAAPQEPAAEPAAEPSGAEVTPETIERFIAVLGSEQQLMRDLAAVEELERMQKTSRAICDWVRAHPESASKARRFATYYMPTTLKLLHTYNEVKEQQGDNAETIRRDIGGILHTLNTAFENLHDMLLSDVAMDVSSEIAALQGMLAQDGLTQNEPLR